jgi:hypothetical protein
MNVRSSSRTGPLKISIARSHTSGFVTHFGNANDSCAYTVNGLTLLAVAASMAWMSSKDLDELANPALPSGPVRPPVELTHQHHRPARLRTGRVDTDQTWRRCRDLIDEDQHGGLMGSDVRMLPRAAPGGRSGAGLHGRYARWKR